MLKGRHEEGSGREIDGVVGKVGCKGREEGTVGWRPRRPSRKPQGEWMRG